MKLIKYGASWCQPCLNMGPVIKQLAKDNSLDLEEKDINLEENLEEARCYGIKTIPALILVEDSLERGRLIGQHSLADCQKWLDALKK